MISAPWLQPYSPLNQSSATALLSWLKVNAHEIELTPKPASVFKSTSFSVPTGRLLRQTLYVCCWSEDARRAVFSSNCLSFARANAFWASISLYLWASSLNCSRRSSTSVCCLSLWSMIFLRWSYSSLSSFSRSSTYFCCSWASFSDYSADSFAWSLYFLSFLTVSFL